MSRHAPSAPPFSQVVVRPLCSTLLSPPLHTLLSLLLCGKEVAARAIDGRTTRRLGKADSRSTPQRVLLQDGAVFGTRRGEGGDLYLNQCDEYLCHGEKPNNFIALQVKTKFHTRTVSGAITLEVLSTGVPWN